MKKLWKVLLVFALLATTISPFVSAHGDSSEPSWQPAVHNDGLNFQATYQNGAVHMTWNKFVPQSSTWKYWKVVRSTNKQYPVYPDDGYIKYAGDQNFTSYTDTNPPRGTVYYGVCAITRSDRGKHRNCDRQAVNVDGSSDTSDGGTATDGGTTVTPPATGLSDAMKHAVDGLMTKFQKKLTEKFGSEIAGKKAFLTALIPVIDNVITHASSHNKAMFEYLKTKIVEYQGIVELEEILNID